MTKKKVSDDTQRMQVTVERLFSIIKAVYDDKLDTLVIERFGKEVLLLTREQAQRWHSFVDGHVAATPSATAEGSSERIAARNMQVMGPRLRSVMGAAGGPDTPHCRPG